MILRPLFQINLRIFFFEDSFLHDDMEFINIEEDDEEELIEKIYEYSDPAQNTFL